MKSSHKWLVAAGASLSLGIAALAAHAAADQSAGPNEQMRGGMHHGAQDGKRPGAAHHGAQGAGEHGMAMGMGNATPGERRNLADAGRTARHGGGHGMHQHGQVPGSGEDKGSGEHAH